MCLLEYEDVFSSMRVWLDIPLTYETFLKNTRKISWNFCNETFEADIVSQCCYNTLHSKVCFVITFVNQYVNKALLCYSCAWCFVVFNSQLYTTGKWIWPYFFIFCYRSQSKHFKNEKKKIIHRRMCLKELWIWTLLRRSCTQSLLRALYLRSGWFHVLELQNGYR